MKEKIEMIKKLAETLEVPVKEEDGQITIAPKETDNVLNTDLLDFLRIYIKNENDIIINRDEIVVMTRNFGAQQLKMMVDSLFADVYNTVVPEQGKIVITRKENLNTPVTSAPVKNETLEKDYKELAERLDNDFVEIAVYENRIEVVSENDKTLEAVARLADTLDETLNIEIQRKLVVIK
jgi:bifunctional DNA-binding transcriptional regulator/antitoxin component of YhaV-PrlF toxin-antitoxin module